MNRMIAMALACVLCQQSPQDPAPDPFGDAPQEARIDKGRAFSAMQMTGKPDTPKPGDYSTCWAAAQQDGKKVWLDLTYPRLVAPAEVWVYENCAPGAVFQVTGIDDGEEFQLWRGVDPTPRSAERGVSKIRVKTNRRLQRVRVYLDCKKVKGWNEIDAVGLLDQQGQMQWAVTAAASSVYGQGDPFEFHDPFADPEEERREKLDELAVQIERQRQSLLGLKRQVALQEASLKRLEEKLKELTRRQ